MRHRSLSIFLILVASLVAVPQASQQLMSFKSAVGERLRAEIWSAFLGMHADARESGIVPVRARAAHTPAADMARATAATAARAKKNTGGGRPDAAGEPAAAASHMSEHLAMLDDPASAIPLAKLDPDFEDAPFAHDAAEDFALRVRRGSSAPRFETAMIIPPGDDMSPTHGAAARQRERARGAEVWAHGLKLEELQKNATYIASRLREGKSEARWADAEFQLHLNAFRRGGDKSGAPPVTINFKKVVMPVAAPAVKRPCPSRQVAFAAPVAPRVEPAPPAPHAGE